MTAPNTPPTTNPDGSSANGGRTATLGAVVSILGVVAAIAPKTAPIVGAITAAAPYVPVLMTAGGSVLAAFGHPPKWLRRLFGK